QPLSFVCTLTVLCCGVLPMYPTVPEIWTAAPATGLLRVASQVLTTLPKAGAVALLTVTPAGVSWSSAPSTPPTVPVLSPLGSGTVTVQLTGISVGKPYTNTRP